MFQEYNLDQLIKMKHTIQQVIRNIESNWTNLEDAIKQTSNPAEKNTLFNETAALLKISTFELDEWSGTQEEAIQCFQKLLHKIEQIDQSHSQIDNLDELLNELRERGFVFLPPDLLRHIWELGEATTRFLQTKQNGQLVEEKGIDVMNSAAHWVQACHQRWRDIKHDELTSVRPIDKEPF